MEFTVGKNITRPNSKANMNTVSKPGKIDLPDLN